MQNNFFQTFIVPFGQLIVAGIPLAIIGIILAFNSEAHRGQGTDLAPRLTMVALITAGIPLVVWLWLIVQQFTETPLDISSLKFWLPTIVSVLTIPLVVLLINGEKKEQQQARINQQAKEIAEFTAQVKAGDLTRSCDLAVLKTRSNDKSQRAVRVVAEEDMAVCRSYIDSIQDNEKKSSEFNKFIVADDFIVINPDEFSQSHSSPTILPASHQLWFLKDYYATLIRKYSNVSDEEFRTFLFILNNQLPALTEGTWSTEAKDHFTKETLPKIRAMITEFKAKQRSDLAIEQMITLVEERLQNYK